MSLILAVTLVGILMSLTLSFQFQVARLRRWQLDRYLAMQVATNVLEELRWQGYERLADATNEPFPGSIPASPGLDDAQCLVSIEEVDKSAPGLKRVEVKVRWRIRKDYWSKVSLISHIAHVEMPDAETSKNVHM